MKRTQPENKPKSQHSNQRLMLELPKSWSAPQINR